MSAARPILVRNVRPVGFTPAESAGGATDIAIGADGRIAQLGASLLVPAGAKVVDGGGAYVSPGWTDLHAHVRHGGTLFFLTERRRRRSANTWPD